MEQALKQINWFERSTRIGEYIEAYPEFLFYHIGQKPQNHGIGFIAKNTLKIYTLIPGSI